MIFCIDFPFGFCRLHSNRTSYIDRGLEPTLICEWGSHVRLHSAKCLTFDSYSNLLNVLFQTSKQFKLCSISSPITFFNPISFQCVTHILLDTCDIVIMRCVCWFLFFLLSLHKIDGKITSHFSQSNTHQIIARPKANAYEVMLMAVFRADNVRAIWLEITMFR